MTKLEKVVKEILELNKKREEAREQLAIDAINEVKRRLIRQGEPNV